MKIKIEFEIELDTVQRRLTDSDEENLLKVIASDIKTDVERTLDFQHSIEHYSELGSDDPDMVNFELNGFKSTII